jgi:hypothetical protein
MVAPQTINPNGIGLEWNLPPELAFDATMRHAPASNTAATLTLAADASRRNILSQIHLSYSAAPAAGSTIKVEDGAGTTVYEQYIAAGGPQVISFSPPLAGTANTALVVTLAAGGTGISGEIYLSAYKLQ